MTREERKAVDKFLEIAGLNKGYVLIESVEDLENELERQRIARERRWEAEKILRKYDGDSDGRVCGVTLSVIEMAAVSLVPGMDGQGLSGMRRANANNWYRYLNVLEGLCKMLTVQARKKKKEPPTGR